MTVPVNDMLEIKTAIVEIKGEIRTMSEVMRSGDRDSASGVRLLAQTVENLAKNQDRASVDLKDALKEFRDAIDAVKELSAQQANSVRVDVERQLREHLDDDTPHSRSLSMRITALENDAVRIRVLIAALTFIGWGGVAAIVKFAGN